MDKTYHEVILIMEFYCILQVSLDGYILLGSPWAGAPPSPVSIPVNVAANPNIIAPFWNDLRTGSDSQIWMQVYYKYAPSTNTQWNRNIAVIEQFLGNMTSLSGFQPVQALIVTWENMLPIDDVYSTGEEVSQYSNEYITHTVNSCQIA